MSTNKETEITIELNQEKAVNRALQDIISDNVQSSKRKDRIILVAIICILIEALGFFGGFVWYESQFETKTTETTEISTEGDNANAEYNSVQGDQYNDSSVHNEGN